MQGLDHGLPQSSSASAQSGAFTPASPVNAGLPQGFPDFASQLPKPQLPHLPQPMAAGLMAGAGRRLQQVGFTMALIMC